MKTLKKLLAVVLALCFMAGLAACNQGGEPKTPGTSPKEEPVKQEIDYDNLVTDAHSQTIGAGVYSIPQINYESEDCAAINAEIWETLYDGVVATLSPDYPLFEGDGIFYKWSVHKDVLSLLIESTTADIGWTDYYAYNVDLSDGTEMTNAEILSKADLTFSEYQTKIQTVVEANFYGNMAATDAGSIDVSYIDSFNSCLQKSIDVANIEETTAYFNENGQLCTVIKIYSMAGADYYWNILNLSDEAPGLEEIVAVEEPAAAQDAVAGEPATEETVTTEEVPEEQASSEVAAEEPTASQGTVLSEEEAQAKLEAWIGDLGTWGTGEPNWLMCDGLYECDGKNYYQFRLKGRVDDHSTTLTLYVISEDGTEIFEGSCDQGSLNRY